MSDGSGKPTVVSEAWVAFVATRNRLAHPTHAFTPKDLADLCREVEAALIHVLQGLGFIARYEVLSVNQIEVIKRRSKDAQFKHRFSRVVGVSENFKAREDSFPQFMDSHAVVLKRRDSFDYLDLSPLVIHGNEGEKQVPDIFLYTGAKGAGYIFSACNNGGTFDSRYSSIQEYLQEDMASFLETFAPEGA